MPPHLKASAPGDMLSKVKVRATVCMATGGYTFRLPRFIRKLCGWNSRSSAGGYGLRACCGLVLLAMLAGICQADAGTVGKTDAAPPIAKVPPTIPDPYKINMLIRTTLIALSQANQTGNYSVLRDLGTPQFQAMNTDARLAEIFSSLRQRNLDLSPVLFFNPTLLREPAVQDNGILRVTGFLDTKPQRVLFDMGFQSIEGEWRLTAIVVDIKAPKANPNEPAASPEKKGKAGESSSANSKDTGAAKGKPKSEAH